MIRKKIIRKTYMAPPSWLHLRKQPWECLKSLELSINAIGNRSSKLWRRTNVQTWYRRIQPKLKESVEWVLPRNNQPVAVAFNIDCSTLNIYLMISPMWWWREVNNWLNKLPLISQSKTQLVNGATFKDEGSAFTFTNSRHFHQIQIWTKFWLGLDFQKYKIFVYVHFLQNYSHFQHSLQRFNIDPSWQNLWISDKYLFLCIQILAIESITPKPANVLHVLDIHWKVMI